MYFARTLDDNDNIVVYDDNGDNNDISFLPLIHVGHLYYTTRFRSNDRVEALLLLILDK